MNSKLRALVDASGLSKPENVQLRLRFCLLCVNRIRHLLENPGALAALNDFERYLAGKLTEDEFKVLKLTVNQIANHHQGSTSIDGTQHAAVSATYALANAISGNAVATAEYAAYSRLYAYSGSAVTDMDAYQEDYDWQVAQLKELLGRV